MTNNEAMVLLTKLGDTADEVAESLAKLGIRGRRDSHCDCPLTNYLLAQGVLQPAVRYNSVDLYDPVDCCWKTYPLPIGCARFVIAFDHSSYPDLIQEPK